MSGDTKFIQLKNSFKCPFDLEEGKISVMILVQSAGNWRKLKTKFYSARKDKCKG